MKIIIPHPPKELRPNHKCHWAVKANKGKKHKHDCYILARVRKNDIAKDKDLYLTITFYPRTKHKIDRDNALSSLKWGLDGLAEAWGIDDSRFIPFVNVGKPVKGGKVIIEVMQ